MQETEWLWNELRDIYRAPDTYVHLRRDAWRWYTYTSFFVEDLREFVLSRGVSVENSIALFLRKSQKMHDMDMARAGFAVAKAALEIWRCSGRERRFR